MARKHNSGIPDWEDGEIDKMAMVLAARDGSSQRLFQLFSELYRRGYIDEEIYRDAMADIHDMVTALRIGEKWGKLVRRHMWKEELEELGKDEDNSD